MDRAIAPDPVDIPKQIRDAVTTGTCILLFGRDGVGKEPEAVAIPIRRHRTAPSGGALSAHLADLCKYTDADKENLAKVSLFYGHSRSTFCHKVEKLGIGGVDGTRARSLPRSGSSVPEHVHPDKTRAKRGD